MLFTAKPKSGSYNFKKIGNCKHTDEYKARMDDFDEIVGEYNPTTEKGQKRLKELADLERKVLPCGNATILG